MKTIELDTLLELAENQAREVLLGHQRRSLAPTWLMLNAAGKASIISTPWRDDFEKGLAEVFMRIQVKKFEATCYSFLFEAWVSTRDTMEGPRPCKDPNRREVIMCLASNGTETKWRQWEIRRDWHERIVRFGAPRDEGLQGLRKLDGESVRQL